MKFRYEEDSERAETELNNRWFNGKPIYAELSPVTDFHEACCRQYQMGECPRGGFCNFMHLKPISNSLRRKLYSVKYRKPRGGAEEFEEEGEGYGMSGRGYSDDYDPSIMGMNGIGGGNFYDGTDSRKPYDDRRGGGGRDRDRSRSPGSKKRGRHDRDRGGSRRH